MCNTPPCLWADAPCAVYMCVCAWRVQMFKRLFPPDLFAAFIDVGHYNAALTAYSPLVQQFEGVRGWGRGGGQGCSAAGLRWLVSRSSNA